VKMETVLNAAGVALTCTYLLVAMERGFRAWLFRSKRHLLGSVACVSLAVHQVWYLLSTSPDNTNRALFYYGSAMTLLVSVLVHPPVIQRRDGG
jgi:hypothetical protein